MLAALKSIYLLSFLDDEKEILYYKNIEEKKRDKIKIMNTNTTNIRSNHLYKVYFEYFSNSLKLKQNELRVKEQECKHLEKLLEAERMKTQNLMKQIEDLSNLNSQLSMQNTDAKRRLVSLELVKYDFNTLKLLIE